MAGSVPPVLKGMDGGADAKGGPGDFGGPTLSDAKARADALMKSARRQCMTSSKIRVMWVSAARVGVGPAGKNRRHRQQMWA